MIHVGAASEVVLAFRDGSFLHVETVATPARFRIATMNDASGFDELQEAGLFNVNLLANPGAEAGPGAIAETDVEAIPGWATTSTFTAVKYGTTSLLHPVENPNRFGAGNNFFAGGPENGFSSASQTIDVTPLASLIDAGMVLARLDAFMRWAVSSRPRVTMCRPWWRNSWTPAGI